MLISPEYNKELYYYIFKDEKHDVRKVSELTQKINQSDPRKRKQRCSGTKADT